MPKFSIIVPVYNVAPYLRECLDSVLAQIFTDWECLCVDDGSTDESGAILDEYAAKDFRFRVFHKPNGGVSSARNLALDNVQGEWILFLDGDDLWYFKTLESLDKILKKHSNVEILSFKWNAYYHENGIQWDCVDEPNFVNIIHLEDCISSSVGLYPLFTRVYKKTLINGLRFKNVIVGEDVLFLTNLLLKAGQQHSIQTKMYGYRLRKGSVTHSSITKRKVLDNVCFILDLLRVLSETDKKVPYAIYRPFLNKYIEEIYASLCQFPRTERKEVLNAWKDGIMTMIQMKIITGFQRFRVMILASVPFKWTMFCLCLVPYWLKKKGIHR